MTKGRRMGINKERQSHNLETASRLSFSPPLGGIHPSLTCLRAPACYGPCLFPSPPPPAPPVFLLPSACLARPIWVRRGKKEEGWSKASGMKETGPDEEPDTQTTPRNHGAEIANIGEDGSTPWSTLFCSPSLPPLSRWPSLPPGRAPPSLPSPACLLHLPARHGPVLGDDRPGEGHRFHLEGQEKGGKARAGGWAKMNGRALNHVQVGRGRYSPI